MATPPPVKPSLKKPPLPPPSKKPPTVVRTPKVFKVHAWTGKGEGEKIVAYGGSGYGKTTLASLLPGPVFIGCDDGGRKIRNPITGKPVYHVEGITDFQDVRDALQTPSLYEGHKSVVVDTITMVEQWAEPWMFEHIKNDKSQRVSSLEGYGWGKGYKHSLDTMRLILQDLDALMRRGLNVCLLAQEAAVKTANSAGIDYIQDGPKLHHNNQHSTRLEVVEWADHVFRIGYYNMEVTPSNEKGTRGKALSGDSTRAIYAVGAPHFIAKSRTVTEPIISYESPQDDSLWRLVFEEGD